MPAESDAYGFSQTHPSFQWHAPVSACTDSAPKRQSETNTRTPLSARGRHIEVSPLEPAIRTIYRLLRLPLDEKEIHQLLCERKQSGLKMQENNSWIFAIGFLAQLFFLLASSINGLRRKRPEKYSSPPHFLDSERFRLLFAVFIRWLCNDFKLFSASSCPIISICGTCTCRGNGKNM